jgi:hypothetical protein
VRTPERPHRPHPIQRSAPERSHGHAAKSRLCPGRDSNSYAFRPARFEFDLLPYAAVHVSSVDINSLSLTATRPEDLSILIRAVEGTSGAREPSRRPRPSGSANPCGASRDGAMVVGRGSSNLRYRPRRYRSRQPTAGLPQPASRSRCPTPHRPSATNPRALRETRPHGRQPHQRRQTITIPTRSDKAAARPAGS